MCDAMGSSSLKQDDTTCEQEESALPHYNYTHKIYVREKRRERRRKTVASSQKTECHVLWRLIRFVILLRHESYVCGCGWWWWCGLLWSRCSICSAVVVAVVLSGCVLWLIVLVFVSASLKACKKYTYVHTDR